MHELKKALESQSEDCLYLDIWQPKDVQNTVPKWTIIYFCDGYHSLYGLASNEEARTRLKNLTPMLSVWPRVSKTHFLGNAFY